MLLDLNKLNQLQTLARAGSFSRAAVELQTSQPALSRSISAIERSFGFLVFERGRRGIVPTPIGARVLTEVDELLRRARMLEHNLRLFGGGQAGDIAFGLGPLVASLTLADLGAYIFEKHPNLEVKTSVKANDILLQELLGEEIEMMFAGFALLPERDDVMIESIGEIEIATIVRAGHPLAATRSVTLRDLDAFPLATAAPRHLAAYRVDLASTLICENYDILHKLVLRSDAVWVSSPRMVADDLRAGRLVKINLVDMPSTSTSVGVLRLRGCTPSPAALSITNEMKRLLVKVAQDAD
jgi:DNA-binding transcriptional LysR family regulator